MKRHAWTVVLVIVLVNIVFWILFPDVYRRIGAQVEEIFGALRRGELGWIKSR